MRLVIHDRCLLHKGSFVYIENQDASSDDGSSLSYSFDETLEAAYNSAVRTVPCDAPAAAAAVQLHPGRRSDNNGDINGSNQGIDYERLVRCSERLTRRDYNVPIIARNVLSLYYYPRRFPDQDYRALCLCIPSLGR